MKISVLSRVALAMVLGGTLVACDDGEADGGGGGGPGGDAGADEASGGSGVGGGSSSGGSASGGAATGGGSAVAEGCESLCSAAGYDGAEEQDFGEVIECLCAGEGEPLEQDACSAYCSDFDVAPSASYLSSQADDGALDKCVCDGTSAGY
jgi:hypothetical protein